MRKLKVLLADDSEFERIRVKAILEKLGHEVHLATHGVDALTLVGELRPDVVLLDVSMPVLDGLQTARRMRAQDLPWFPIIFVSNHTEPEDIAAGIDAGGDDYLTKPLNAVVLAAKLLALQRISSMKTLMTQMSGPQSMRDQLAEVAEVDAESGVANELAGKRSLAREYSRCCRAEHPLSIMLLAIDDYAGIRRRHGKEVAIDCVRKSIAALQSNASRLADFLWRFGPDGLSVVMPDTPLTGAIRVAERVRRTLCELESLNVEPGSVALSVSIGVAAVLPGRGRDSAALFSACEDMLEQARTGGGNRVEWVLANDSEPLSEHELECVQWLALGKRTDDIPTLLKVSPETVGIHCDRLLAKLAATSLPEAIDRAVRSGLIRAA